jgi:hypothetical protein
VHVGDLLTARIEVRRARVVSNAQEVLLVCTTIVTNETDANTAISGEAQVLIPKGRQLRHYNNT